MALEDEPSKWTVETVKSVLQTMIDALRDKVTDNDRRYEERFVAQEKAVIAALDSTKEAILKAEAASEKRFEGVNEFRGQLSDQARTFLPRAEAEALFSSSAADRLALRELIAEDRANMREQVAALKTTLDTMQAKGSGMKDGWGWAVAVIMLAFAVYAMLRP